MAEAGGPPPVTVSPSQAVCRCDVFAVSAAGEKLCAMAQGTVVAAPEQNLA